MFALPVAVGNGLEATSIAQGAAGTFSSLLACFRFHAGSVGWQRQRHNIN